VPFNTVGGSLDLSLNSGERSRDMFGVGLNLMSDRAGDSRFTTTRVDVSTAYNKLLDPFEKHYLSAGIQASYTSAYIDYTSLTFDENFENGQTTENMAFTTTRYADASTGLQYTYLADKKNNLTFGAAAFHLNQPRQTFFEDATSVVYRKYVLNASATIGAGDELLFFPKINYSHQGPNNELNFGVFGRYDLAKNSRDNYGMYFGVLHRLKDAVIAVTRFDINDLALTFSYDFNYSKLARVSRGMGGPEVSVQYIGSMRHKPNRKVFCPKF
jgi:type IX secretion system PorP/SprF family membrane protein